MSYPRMSDIDYNFISSHHHNVLLCLENDGDVFRDCKATILSRRGKLPSNEQCKRLVHSYLKMLGGAASNKEIARFKQCINSMYDGEEGWQRFFHELAYSFGILEEE